MNWRRLVLAIMIGALCGCAAQSSVVVGHVRPAVSPETVKIYLRPPKKFEEIALLEASSRQSWAFSDQAKMDVVIQRMREEAARLGANGIILQGAGSQYAGSVGTGVGSATASGSTAYGVGTSVAVPIFVKAGSGVAIFVVEE